VFLSYGIDGLKNDLYIWSMNPFGDNKIVQIKFIASVLIEKYYEQDSCGCGGSLHIVLDDKNISNEDVLFCLKYAEERGDLMGQLICHQLANLSQFDLEDVVYNYSEIANGISDY